MDQDPRRQTEGVSSVHQPHSRDEIGRSPAAPAPSRRQLFRAVGVLAAVGAGTGLVEAVESAPAEAAAGGGPLLAIDPDLHLLRRATYGPTPASLAELKRLGRQNWLDQQLNPGTIDDTACHQLVNKRFPRLLWSIDHARRHYAPDITYDMMRWLGGATVTRAVWSKRQLFEVMVEFWSNHLNITNFSGPTWNTRHDYDRVVIRQHALGRFEDMLWASANHPAMMAYLNNDESTKVEPNENYGRELLELHTVGVDGGYTEADMHQSALIMTGFGIDPATDGFQYTAGNHYVGPVSVMGFSDPNGNADGHAVGQAYLSYLANHRSTAVHIATKLCLRFVSDTPSVTLVNQLADVYQNNQTDVVPVLQALFDSAEFAGSVGKKVRRPYEDLVAATRILGYQPDKAGNEGLMDLYWVANAMGQLPLAWPQPNGYPDEAVAWQSASGTLQRWNTHRALASHWWPHKLRRPNPRTWLPKRLPRTHGAVIDALAKRMVFRTLTPAHRGAILEFLGHRAGDPVTRSSGIVNDRLPHVVALILDAPYHALR